MGESLSDLYGDLMLIPCPPGIPVFVLLLLPLAVFLLIAFSGGLDEPGAPGVEAGGVWTSLGMSEWFQVTGS